MAEHMPMRDALLATCLATTSIFASTSVLADTCDNIDFEAAEEYYVTAVGQFSAFIRCVAAADVDGDGAPDVLASDRYGEEIGILLNDGSGGLVPGGSVLAVECEANRIIILEDLNGDGWVDLASSASAGAAVFLNLGEDSTGNWLGFGELNLYPSGYEPHWIDAADLDLDGDLDLLVPDFGEVGFETGFHVFLNNGDGTFTDGILYNLGLNARCISIIGTDLDSDGYPEVVVVCSTLTAGALAHVYDNAGNDEKGVWSGLDYRVAHLMDFGVCSVRAMDRENDGDTDLVIAHRSRRTMSFMVNDGTGQLEVEEIAVPPYIELAEPVDVNGDGAMDLAVVIRNIDELQIMLNDGDGLFTTVAAEETGKDPKFVAFADLDDDGDLDGMTANSYPGYDFGSITVHENISTDFVGTCVGDITCDKRVDVLDMLEIIGHWGPCQGGDCRASDLNEDEIVDVLDLLLVLDMWGDCGA